MKYSSTHITFIAQTVILFFAVHCGKEEDVVLKGNVVLPEQNPERHHLSFNFL